MATCPDCRRRMQPFFVPAKRGDGEVELDRCSQCGALWFNAGELEAALGKTVRRRQASSSRSCPTCRVKLDGAVLEGRIEVERCGTCAGVFLDGRDVRALGAGAKEPRGRGGSGFVCEGCGERRPFGEATSTFTGLVCGDCAGRVEAAEAKAEAEQHAMLGRFFEWLWGERATS